ncbi:MAG TPA: HAD-IC family P-type ATPase, partial [Candidatus Binatus sp.]|nr:HAD-IC family P-type ATPase [Candidatus Binatus sp.]
MGTSVAPSHPRSAEGPRIGRSYAAILLEAAVTPLNLVLFSVGAALVALGLTIDAAVTAIPVILNIAVQAGLEASAKHRLDQLRILFAPGALVLRAGREERVDVGMLEIGDVIVLGRGDQVVLDGAVVDGEIEIDESLLTGESDPAVRRAGDALLSGSVCVSGRATMRVTRAGDDSYASRLTLQARQDRAERTPLQHDIDRLIALAAGLVVAVSVAVVIAAGGRPPETSGAVQAAAVLVALVPQGLAIMITVSYAMGAVRISRAGALVQRINAVEAMSRVDTLVLDKTGTITSPRFEVRDVAWASPPDAAAWRLVRAIVASQPADDRVGGAIGRWLAAQEPATTDATEARSLTVSDVVAFSSVRRWSGIVVTESDGQIAQVGLLGAPEVLLVSDRDRQLAAVADRWMDRGDRIVVVSRADADSIFGADREPRLPQGHVPLLVLAFAEALRDDAASTLRAIEDAGIAIRIVSGDAPRSASAVAAAVGLAGADRPAARGPALDAL